MIDREPEAPPRQKQPEEGVLYWFFLPTGQRVAVDPFRVARLLAQTLRGRSPLDALADHARFCELARAGQPVDPVTAQGAEQLLAAVQTAFGVPGVRADGSGLNELALVGMLEDFLDWERLQKKSIVLWPTSPPAGAASPPSSPPSVGP